MYFEVAVRYAPYLFKTPGFITQIINMIFSPSGIRCSDPELASRSTYILARLCEKMLQILSTEEERALIPAILENTASIAEEAFSGGS
jgi:hypothetical protein